MAFRAMGEGSQPYVAFDEEKANPPGGRERACSHAGGLGGRALSPTTR